jgi:hypothetical protein
MHKQGEKKLHVHFSFLHDNKLCCTVTDNGIGRKRSGEMNALREKKHTSFATGATQNRLALLNHGRVHPITIFYEDLYDRNEKPAGTRVTLNIPT